MASLPITLQTRTQICHNAVFTVYFDHIRDAAGNEVRDYLSVVPHHRAAHKVSGIAVLPVVADGFGLIRVYRHPLGEYSWEVARGFVDSAETPAQAALRELREETGLVAAEGSLRSLGTIAPEPGVLDARVQLFAAEGCEPGHGASVVEMGHREMKLFARDELRGLIDRGEILDPCTLVLCLKYLSLPA